MKPVVIVKTGSTLPDIAAQRGDFDAWIAVGMGLPAARVCVVQVEAGDVLPPPSEAAGAVVTGSASMVTAREDWSERSAAWLGDAVAQSLPVLGICYGHQLLAHALGGSVGINPNGREIGTVDVSLSPAAADDDLLSGFDGDLRVHASHVESVVELPPGAVHLGRSALDPNQVFRVGDAAWGAQFHPEFDADIMRGYIAGRREAILSEGLDADALTRAVRDGPHGTALLRRFAAILDR